MTTKRLTLVPRVSISTLPGPAPKMALAAPINPDPTQLPLEAARLPESLMPMFPGGASEPFDSREHLFEVRWDGLRALAFVEGGGYHLQDQSGRNISELFPELGEIPRRLGVDEVILDGIVVISDSQGRPDFAALDRRMRLSSPDGMAQAAARQPAAFVVFDILYAEARSVMSMTLLKRRKLLKEVLEGEGRICLSDAVAAEGIAFFDAAREMGIEAVIAKRKDSVYLPGGRSPSWLLVQDVPRQDVVVVGYIPDSHGGAFESLLVGIYVDQQVTYAGAVGGGFDQRTERLLAQALPRPPPRRRRSCRRGAGAGGGGLGASRAGGFGQVQRVDAGGHAAVPDFRRHAPRGRRPGLRSPSAGAAPGRGHASPQAQDRVAPAPLRPGRS